MKRIYDALVVDELQRRINDLRQDTKPQWGRMTAAQAMAHCALATEYALGELIYPKDPIHPIDPLHGNSRCRGA